MIKWPIWSFFVRRLVSRPPAPILDQFWFLPFKDKRTEEKQEENSDGVSMSAIISKSQEAFCAEVFRVCTSLWFCVCVCVCVCLYVLYVCECASSDWYCWRALNYLTSCSHWHVVSWGSEKQRKLSGFPPTHFLYCGCHFPSPSQKSARTRLDTWKKRWKSIANDEIHPSKPAFLLPKASLSLRSLIDCFALFSSTENSTGNEGN